MFEKIISVQTDHRVNISSIYYMTHCIERSLKMKIKNEISNFKSWKVEVGKSKKISSKKKFKKILSVKMDNRVSISSSNECIEWPIALNDHWRWKWKMKFEISKVENLKSENQQNLKSKNVLKIYKCQNGSPSQH